jgi:hypothetical protein
MSLMFSRNGAHHGLFQVLNGAGKSVTGGGKREQTAYQIGLLTTAAEGNALVGGEKEVE